MSARDGVELLQLGAALVGLVGMAIEYGVYSFWNVLIPWPSVASSGDLEKVEKCIQSGANINQNTSRLESAIQLAARNGKRDVVAHLLSKYGTIIEKDSIIWAMIDCCNYLHETSNMETFEVLSCHCADHRVVNRDMMGALCKVAHADTVKKFYNICQQDHPTAIDTNAMLSTFLARFNSYELVRWILQDCHAVPTWNSIEMLTIKNWSPKYVEEQQKILLILAQHGMPEFDLIDSKFDGEYRLLIQAAFQENQSASAQVSELIRAAHCGDVSTIMKYAEDLNMHKRINTIRTASGNTLLGVAASKGHTKAVQALLQNFPCSINATNNNATPLFIAAYNGHAEVVEELLKWNPDRTIVTNSKFVWPGRTALDAAKIQNHSHIVKLLECS